MPITYNLLTVSQRLTGGLYTALLGMSVVFIGLVVLIYLFKLMSLTLNRKRKEEAAPVADIVEEPIVEEVSEADDGELVAVIGAAIAAYCATSAPSGKLVVRSVRRVGTTVPLFAALGRSGQIFGR